jgi:methylated-DNA-[protein]-cysteine S-methyltransferase
MRPLDERNCVWTTMDTPIGRLAIEASPRGLRRVEFSGRVPAGAGKQAAGPEAEQARQHLTAALGELGEYFAGRRSTFTVPLDLEGTAYQQRVWHALLRVPFGKTLSYGKLAGEIGARGGARAVGRACATNPVPVVVPCHRVIGSDGALHGFGGGLWRKEQLLELENAKR